MRIFAMAYRVRGRLLWIFIILAGVALGILADQSYRRRSPPILKVALHHLNLGEGKPRQQLTGQFLIANAGGQPLTFSTTPSCGCTSLQPQSGVVPANASQPIQVAVELPSSTGTRRDIQILLKTNDPRNPAIVCTAEADCPSPLACSPPYVAFGTISTDEIGSVERLFTVCDRKGDLIRDPALLDVTCQSEHVVVDVIPGKHSDGCAVRVRLSSSLPPGETTSSVRVRHRDHDIASDVPINVTRVAPVLVAPPTIIRGTGNLADNKESHTVFVWRSGADPELGKLLSVDAPQGVRVRERSSSVLHKRCYDVLFTQFSEAVSPGSIRLVFENAGVITINILASR